MMEILLYLCVGSFFIYLIILLQPKILSHRDRRIAGVFFWIFCILFLIEVYHYKSSIWLVLLSIPLLFIFNIIVNILTGAIARSIMKKRNKL